MSWKFLLTCLILLIVGFLGLNVLDQKIDQVNQKLIGAEKQVYVDQFKSNLVSYIENIKVNLSLFTIIDNKYISKKWLARFSNNYASLYTAFDSLYLLNNNDVEYSYSNNIKHRIQRLTYEQQAKITTDLYKAATTKAVAVSKPLDFFDDSNNYILFFVPIDITGKKYILALFNFEKIIDQNINALIQLKDVSLYIRTNSNKLIYGNHLEDIKGERILIEGFVLPIGEWNFEIIVANSNQYDYLRNLVWVMGFSLMAFFVFYMLIVERKNRALTDNFEELKKTEEELKKQYKREQLVRIVIQKIHSAKEIEVLLNDLCKDLGEFFNVDAVWFLECKEKKIIKNEYASERIKESFIGDVLNLNSSLEHIIEEKKSVFISNDLIKEGQELFEGLSEFKQNQVKSVIFAPVVYDESILSLIGFAKVQKGPHWSVEEIEFIKFVISQISLAFVQANLNSELSFSSRTIIKSLNEEHSIRRVLEVIRTTLDVEEICEAITKEISEFLNVDKVFLLEYDQDKRSALAIRGEYNRFEDQKILKNDKTIFSQVNEFLCRTDENVLLNQIIANDTYAYLKDKLPVDPVKVIKPELISASFVCTPLIYQNKLLASLIVNTYQDKKHWLPDELDYLNKMAEQAAVAFYQIKIYDELKNFTDKQIVINKIFEVIRSSIDINEILKNACDEIGKYFEVDKCLITQYDKERKQNFPVKFEYKITSELKSTVGYVININPDDSYIFHCLINEKRPFIVDNILEMTDNQTDNETLSLFKNNETKSFAILPIIYSEDVLGFLYLAQINYTRRWNDSEIYFLKSLVSQIAIAIHQANLFIELSKANQRLMDSYKKEQIVRQVLEVVRSSLDLDEIYKSITQQIGISLRLNRCYFTPYNPKMNKIENPTIEYRSADHYLSMINMSIPEEINHQAVRVLKMTTAPFIVDNVQEFNLQNVDLKFPSDMGAQSIILVPVAHQGEPLGVLFAVQASYQRVWTSDEIEILKTIGHHIGIAISQIKMYHYVQQASKLKSEFLANVSHELKTPLNSIIVLSELMQDKSSIKSEEEEVELLKIIHSSGEELLKHINNILDMAKVEFTRRDVSLLLFNIRDLVNDLRRFIKPIADDKSLKLFVNIGEEVSESICSDKELIKFIINNLLNNAIKFTSKGFVELNVHQINSLNINDFDIDFNIDKKKEFLFIHVKDTGIGIEEKYHDVIFDEFRQIEDSEVRTYSGTGLGLSICKKSVDILNGKIWLKSKPQEGSEFYVLIPIML